MGSGAIGSYVTYAFNYAGDTKLWGCQWLRFLGIQGCRMGQSVGTLWIIWDVHCVVVLKRLFTEGWLSYKGSEYFSLKSLCAS